MAEVPIFQVDIFTSDHYRGNPAAVCPVPQFLDDDIMQAIARENNLSETAFMVPSSLDNADFELRWFTPNNEVDLCSHSTIAAAYVVMNFLETDWQTVRFNTVKGRVKVDRIGGLYSITLPLIDADLVEEEPSGLREAMGGPDIQHLYHTGNIYHAVYEDRAIIEGLIPDYDMMLSRQSIGFIASAPDDTGLTDYVSRCFYPSLDIKEDPVTMTSYRISVSHWAKALGKKTFLSHQLSHRGGQIWMTLGDDSVTIRGEAEMISQGSLFITGIE